MISCPHCGFRIEPSARPLTVRQRQLYSFLVDYSAKNGNAPSFEEIAHYFDYNSLATVHEHLSNLERKGYITRSYNESRAITCLVPLSEVGAPTTFVANPTGRQTRGAA